MQHPSASPPRDRSEMPRKSDRRSHFSGPRACSRTSRRPKQALEHMRKHPKHAACPIATARRELACRRNPPCPRLPDDSASALRARRRPARLRKPGSAPQHTLALLTVTSRPSPITSLHCRIDATVATPPHAPTLSRPCTSSRLGLRTTQRRRRPCPATAPHMRCTALGLESPPRHLAAPTGRFTAGPHLLFHRAAAPCRSN